MHCTDDYPIEIPDSIGDYMLLVAWVQYSIFLGGTHDRLTNGALAVVFLTAFVGFVQAFWQIPGAWSIEMEFWGFSAEIVISYQS